MSEISHIRAREILDSRGNPTLEAEVELRFTTSPNASGLLLINVQFVTTGRAPSALYILLPTTAKLRVNVQCRIVGRPPRFSSPPPHSSESLRKSANAQPPVMVNPSRIAGPFVPLAVTT